jgi:outer membrane protein assembly factor BamA
MIRHMRIAAAVLIGAMVSSPAGLTAVSAFTVGIALSAQQVQAQAFRFTSFLIEGNQRITDETIIAYTGITPGAGVSAGQVNDALQNLQDSGLFERVELIPRGGTLVIRVLEYPTINRIAIEGNRRIDDDDLLSILQSQARRVYSPAAAEQDAAAIAEAYRVSGRLTATVNPVDHPARRQPRRSRLRSDRGPRGGNPAHRLRRQPRIFRPPPAPRSGKHAGRAVRA